MSSLIFRAVIVIFAATWLGGMIVASLDSSYAISSEISSVSWELYSAASISGLILMVGSIISLFFFWRYGRATFCVFLVFVSAYNLIYGFGSGGNFLAVISDIHNMAAGMILCAIFFTPIQDRFTME